MSQWSPLTQAYYMLDISFDYFIDYSRYIKRSNLIQRFRATVTVF